MTADRSAYNTYAQGLTPKRPYKEVEEAADVLPYYAGYSYSWALNRMRELTAPGDIVLDPWNGAGTSTLAAGSLGLTAIGIDLNPAVNVIARARQVGADAVPAITRPPSGSIEGSGSDPLTAWFGPTTVARIRDWVNHAKTLGPAGRDILLVSIFATVRSLTRAFEGSNPTWVRTSKSPEECLEMDALELDDAIELAAKRTLSTLLPTSDAVPATIIEASASRLPIKDNSVDTVIASPPYLTRIDYAVAYSRELAVLGIDGRTSALRSNLMGTTKIRRNVTSQKLARDVRDILERIESHSSKESSGYYLKQAIQYFSDLHSSALELTRVCSKQAIACVVLQDSYYKDVHVPLDDVYVATMAGLGWVVEDIERTPAPRLITHMNSTARSYKKGRIVESVVTLRRRCDV